MRHRKLVLASLLASLCLHIGAIWFFHEQRFLLGGRTERRKVLHVAGAQHLILREVPFAPRHASRLPQGEQVHPALPNPVPEPKVPPQAFAARLEARLAPLQSKAFPPLFDLASQLPEAPTPSPSKREIRNPLPWTGQPTLASPLPKPYLPLPTVTEENALAAQPPTRSAFSFPPLPRIPSLSDLQTLSPNDAFEIELEMTRDDNNGTLFALTLWPRTQLELPRIPQRITFLIDRSNSIQQSRLRITKAAIAKAIEGLDPEDTFNIIAFDHKLTKAFPQWVTSTEETLAEAETFLTGLELGSLFHSSDLFNPLALTVPYASKPDEHHTVFLITDGEGFSKERMQDAILSSWTLQNQGKVSLYTLALDSDPYLSFLENASLRNRGKVITASTGRGLKRRLLKLMRSLHNPIAQEITCVAYSRRTGAPIALYPAHHLPNLFRDDPLVLWGRADTLDDFLLVVQGRLKEGWLTIRKEISFAQAKKGGDRLRNHWAHLLEIYGPQNP